MRNQKKQDQEDQQNETITGEDHNQSSSEQEESEEEEEEEEEDSNQSQSQSNSDEEEENDSGEEEEEQGDDQVDKDEGESDQNESQNSQSHAKNSSGGSYSSKNLNGSQSNSDVQESSHGQSQSESSQSSQSSSQQQSLPSRIHDNQGIDEVSKELQFSENIQDRKSFQRDDIENSKNYKTNKDRSNQSFVKLQSDQYRVTSQSSNEVSSTGRKKKKKKDQSNNEKSDYRVYFGDPDQISKNQNKKYENKVRTQRYTALNWAPKSLLYQFKRVSNVYFLIISILTFMSFSPKDPISMISTFILVLFFTMLKEAYEDYQRYKQDKEVNNKQSWVLNPLTMQFESKKWEDIEPGNIVKFLKDNEAPADIVIVYSSNKSGVVYVDTMNLDGETNLKEKYTIFENLNEDKLVLLNGEIRCDQPNENLDKWDARLQMKTNQLKPPISSIKNLILRGCIVRNTSYGIGIVVYTGMKTKIMKNSKKTPLKSSNIMKLMNKMLYSVFAFQILLITVFAGLNVNWISENSANHKYLNLDSSQNEAGSFFIQMLVYWVAYSHMIPISLYVIIEILKLGSASYINKDILMYDQETESYARCRDSGLIEELGQIQMIFSDKTGTLTQNKMIFKKCQINGIKYGDIQQNEKDNVEGMVFSGIKEIRNQIKEEIIQSQSKQNQRQFHYAIEFFQNLALCNTVVCEKNKNTNEIVYKAQSPDELALVQGAKICGIQLISREHNRITIFNMLNKKQNEYKVLAEFPFDSVRKRMSVILQDEKGQYQLLTKGADSVMIDRITFDKNGIEDIKNIIEEDLYHFSCEGLRTLMMSQRTICKAEYEQFEKIYQNLQQSGSANKEQKLFDLYDAMERKLRYLGSTAIEDKLQEGVPQTIARLLEADIRFFMLTGDKLETAIEIAKSCQVIQDDMAVIILSQPSREKIKKRLRRILTILNIDIEEEIYSLNQVNQEKQVITIDGSTLAILLADEYLSKLFFHVAIRSKSVVCCRMSPKQKADVVQMFKSRGKWITLAIGDGANDVSMILEAHIGVGIKGKEGTQAVRSADFAISQFQFLLRLVLLHGRYGYLRVSQMICYYFYKNIVLVFTELYFAFYNGFSGQIFFLDWLPMLYNAFFTSWHCLFSQLLEKDLNEHYSYRYPIVYKAGQLGRYFNFKVFWQWIILAMWHGVVCFYGPMIAGSDQIDQDSSGKRGDHWLHSTISFTIIINLVFYKLLLETRHLNSITMISGIISMLLYYAVLLLSQIPQISQIFQPQIQGLVEEMVNYPKFWLMLLAIPIICLLPDFVIKTFMKVYYPNPVDVILTFQKEDPEFDFEYYLEMIEKRKQAKKRKKSVQIHQRKTIIEEKKKPVIHGEHESLVELHHFVENDEDEEYQNEEESGKKKRNNGSHKKIRKRASSLSDILNDNNKKSEDQSIEDEDEQTDSDDNSGTNSSYESHQTNNEEDSDSYGQEEGEQEVVEEEKEEDEEGEEDDDNSENHSPTNSNAIDQSSQNMSASSRSMLNQSLQSNKQFVEIIRGQKIKQKKEEELKQVEKKNKENPQKQKKNIKDKEIGKKKRQNHSIFSVSDASKIDFIQDKSANSHYLEYFEDFNKEFADKKNTNQNKPNKSKANNKIEEEPFVIDQLRRSKNSKTKEVIDLRDSKNQIVKDFHSNKPKNDFSSISVLVPDIDLPGKTTDGLNKLKVQSSHQNLQSYSDDDQKAKDKEFPIEEQKRPQTSNHPLNKDVFKKILGNRTQDIFSVTTKTEIPKSTVIKPHQIVDNIAVNANIVQDGPTSVQQKLMNYIFGHPLESNKTSYKTPNKTDEEKGIPKKKKKYLEKYAVPQNQD